MEGRRKETVLSKKDPVAQGRWRPGEGTVSTKEI